jgi:hypothetical protein
MPFAPQSVEVSKIDVENCILSIIWGLFRNLINAQGLSQQVNMKCSILIHKYNSLHKQLVKKLMCCILMHKAMSNIDYFVDND